MELSHADIQFYLKNNPGYAQGDLLACYAELNARNWNSILRKGLKRMMA